NVPADFFSTVGLVRFTKTLSHASRRLSTNLASAASVTQQVAWLNFTAATGQSSAFVSLKLDNGVGLQPDGTEVRNFAPQAGRTVVVGNEPLLEAVLTSNRQPALILYGQPAPDFRSEERRVGKECR